MNARFHHGLLRLLVLALGIGVLFLGGLVVAETAGWMAPGRWMLGGGGAWFHLDTSALGAQARWAWAGAGVLGVALGFALLALALAPTTETRERRARVRLSGARRGDAFPGSGELTVGMPSLLALVAHEAERDPAVREAIPSLQLRRKGWHLGCRTVLTPEAAVPEVADRLRQRLEGALERHTGLPVVRTDLDVQLFPLDARRRVQ